MLVLILGIDNCKREIMKIEQIYTGCLAQGAYYIESDGEVAIIDPLREVSSYIEMATKRGAVIKYIFETHFHADFVSGHLTLAEKTGAKIIYGPNANPNYSCTIAKDKEVFKLGKITLEVIHTPGHTMESSCFLLRDKQGKEHSVFTGDTLFLGDVGRPDLAQKSDITREDLAGMLFDSLRNKVMLLPDDVVVYPGHGAGSACGKNMSKETIGSIGHEKKENYALRSDMTKEEFINEVTDGLEEPPAYFPQNVNLNKNGYQNVEEVISKASPLAPDAFETMANLTGALVLDVRSADDFAACHVPRSTFIGIDGPFAPWVGALVKDVNQPLLLVVPEGELNEVVTRLSRVGFDNVLGYLEGGVENWKQIGKETDSVESISPEEFYSQHSAKKGNIFDVRKPSEYVSQSVVGAVNTPLNEINEQLSVFTESTKGEDVNYIHCGGGYRSMIAISILKSRGLHDFINVEKGFAGIKETDIEKTEFVCPSTL